MDSCSFVKPLITPLLWEVSRYNAQLSSFICFARAKFLQFSSGLIFSLLLAFYPLFLQFFYLNKHRSSSFWYDETYGLDQVNFTRNTPPETRDDRVRMLGVFLIIDKTSSVVGRVRSTQRRHMASEVSVKSQCHLTLCASGVSIKLYRVNSSIFY